MSYAGLYESCPHGEYARQCGHCSGAYERLRREMPYRLAHPADAASMEVTNRTVVLYEATCPNRLCGWHRSLADAEELQERITEHIDESRRVAAEWASTPVPEASVPEAS